MTLLLLILVVSFVFGLTCDVADLLDEHGLRWFKYADVIFGVLWGVSAWYLIHLDSHVAVFVTALILYWLIKNKLDFFNHALAGCLALLGALSVASQGLLDVYAVTVVFLALTGIGFWASSIKKSYILSPLQEKLLIARHFVAPLVASLLTVSFLPLYAFVAWFVGVRLSTAWFDHFEKTGNSHIARLLGMKIE